MAVVSVINRSQLEDTTRIDAEYYHPESLSLEKEILRTKSCRLWKCLGGQFITGPFGSEFNVENYVTGSPYRYVRGKDVKEFFLHDEDNVYIPKKDFKRLSKYALEEGDVLISVVGTLGNTVVIDKNVPPAIFSCKSTVFRPKAVNPFYLIAYLNCRFGGKLLERKVRGSVQTGLNIGDLKSLPIFLPNSEIQNELAKIVLKAKKNYGLAKFFYSQAETLLLEELGLKDFKPKYDLSYTANLSDAFNVHRVDAEYFQPAYKIFLEKLRGKAELKPLKKFILGIQKGIEPGSGNYQDEGKPFIRVSNLSVNGFANRDQKCLNEELYRQLRGAYEPKQGDLLLTKDATPGIAYVIKEPVEGIISSGILKLKINESEINKEYLALCINCLIGKMQIERDGGGSVIVHWRPDQVKKLKIPILPDKTQKKITLLVQQSHETRNKAKQLLEIAEKVVEAAIERNEKEAMKFISKAGN